MSQPIGAPVPAEPMFRAKLCGHHANLERCLSLAQELHDRIFGSKPRALETSTARAPEPAMPHLSLAHEDNEALTRAIEQVLTTTLDRI